MTGVGRPAVRAYAARAGQPVDECDLMGPVAAGVTPELAGSPLVELVQADPTTVAPAYMLTGTGLQQQLP